MQDRFEDESLVDALERALLNADHLTSLHAGTVMAARLLARKIDAWGVIVDWALEDVEDAGGKGRPTVPQNDNVSLSSFLKYMNELRLTPPPAATAKAGAAASKPPEAEDEIANMRKRLQSG